MEKLTISKGKDGNVVNALTDNDNLTPDELELMKRGLNEALFIKDKKLKSIPFDELWNDKHRYKCNYV